MYQSVSIVVGNQAGSLRSHDSQDSRFYSANVTPDSGLTSPEIRTLKSPDSNSTTMRYEANSPRMVFPASDLVSERGSERPRDRKPSTSLLYVDRYTERASNSYVPPHAKYTKNSEHTPVRSGSSTLRNPQPIVYDMYKDAMVLTESHHSSRSVAKSMQSSLHLDGYSV